MHVDLCDPGIFERNAFWPMLAWLRRHAPVHRHHEPDGSPFWVLTRHRDILGVYTDSETFSSRQGMRLGSNAAAVAAVSQRMLIVSDSPAHMPLKRTLARAFSAPEMPRIEQLVRQVVRTVLAEGVAAGDVDFIEVAKHIPNRVVCAMMGIPRADWEYIGALTTEAFDPPDGVEHTDAHAEIFLYLTDLLDIRRACPADDLVSQLAHDLRLGGDAGGRLLTDEEIVFNCNGVLSGANETTRYSSAGAVLAFVENPDQWEILRTQGTAVIPTAVEEVLRWTTPGVHTMRTVLKPASIGDVRVAPGDRVTLWNVSANRDEDVFEDASRFRIGRCSNRHVAFGFGSHLCLGARLARLELAVFLEELARQVESFELRGDPTYTPSNFTWGVKSLPVRLCGRPKVAAFGRDQRGVA